MRGPKVKFNKELIVSKSRDYISEYGIHQISIRQLANYIGCSTQPIFRLYKNSKELLEDVYQSIELLYNQTVIEVSEKTDIPFLGMGLGYIAFARDYPNLFYALFMDTYYKKESFLDFFKDTESNQMVEDMSIQLKLNPPNCRNLLRNIWLLTHGIATMIYTKQVNYQDQEIREILGQGFNGFILILKENENV